MPPRKMPDPAPAEAPKPKRRSPVFRRPPRTLTVALVSEALRANAGIRSLAAQRLQVNRSTITKFIHAHPEIEAVEAEILDDLVDLGEAKLIEGIRDGDIRHIKYFLDNKGGAAGYGVKRVAVSNHDDKPFKVQGDGPDLSKLSREELRQYEQLLIKASSKDADGAT